MKKKTIIITLLMAVCMVFAFAGCGGSDSGSSDSGDSGDTNKTTAAEQQKGSGSYFDCPGVGFGFDLPEGVEITKGFIYPYDGGDVNYDSGVMMGWPVYVDVSKDKYDNMTEEDLADLHEASSFHIVCVKDVKNESEAIEKLVSTMKIAEGEFFNEESEKLYRNLKQIHAQDEYIWLSDTPTNKTEGLNEGCQEEYNAFFDATDEIIKNMKFYTPQAWTGTEEGSDLSFETTDLEGNPINAQQIFSQNKITMINIWGTTCGPCIKELPELEKMNKEFKEKGGAVVGLVSDVPVDNNMYLQEAQAIVKDTGVTFLNLKAWEGFEKDLEAVGTPTTYFVDSHGKLIGTPILGAHVDKYKEKMEEYLSEAE